jgi:hypothetical protein
MEVGFFPSEFALHIAVSASVLMSLRYYLVFIIVPAACLPLLWRLPETNGLSLEEIAAKFGDEVAVDLSHLDEERRQALDERLLAIGVDINGSPPADGEVGTKESGVAKHKESA